jgi:hypothetical protein
VADCFLERAYHLLHWSADFVGSEVELENLSDFVMKVIGYLIAPDAMFATFTLLVSYDSFQLKKAPEAGLKMERRTR